MASVDAKLVMDLRARTGLGVMECKEALSESNHDVDAAIEYLRRASKIKSAKKSARVASEGVVLSGVDEKGSYGVLIEINSETDFVARDQSFLDYADQLLDSALSAKPKNVEELMTKEMEEKRQELIQSVGENISVRRLSSFESDKGVVCAYTHNNNRVASLIEGAGLDGDAARDIAMHVAAMAPQVLKAEDVPEESVEQERAIYAAQSEDSDKPADVVAKIVEGKVAKYKTEISLLTQPFVKDPKTKVGKLLESSGGQVSRFARYELGEGVKKSESDFAAEVAAQVEQYRS